MKHLLLLFSILLVSYQSQAAFSYSQAVLNQECVEGDDICSEYTLGIDVQKTVNVCGQREVDHVSELVCPMAKELNDQGFKMIEYGHDHGVATLIEYKGQQIDLGLNEFMAMGEAYNYKLPENYEPAWADWGTANSVYEYRFRNLPCSPDKGCGAREVFALIYRRNFKTSYSNEKGDWKTGSVTSAMIIIKFNGLNTTLYGTVDSIAASKAGKSANDLARQCADSIVGAGDSSACKSFPAVR